MKRIVSVLAGTAPTLTLFCVMAFGAVIQKTLRVNGMTCGGCSASVEQALKRVGGVEDVKAKPGPERTVWVKYDDQKVDIERIRRVIKDTGFQVVDK